MTTLAEDSETRSGHAGHTGNADTQTVQAFETARISQLRRKGQAYSVSILICVMIVVWAFHAAGFADPRVGDGAFAKAAAFLKSMNPELQLDTHCLPTKQPKGLSPVGIIGGRNGAPP